MRGWRIRAGFSQDYDLEAELFELVPDGRVATDEVSRSQRPKGREFESMRGADYSLRVVAVSIELEKVFSCAAETIFLEKRISPEAIKLRNCLFYGSR